MRRIEREPVLEVVADANRAHSAVRDAVPQPQIALLRVPQLPAALLRREQHGKRGVFGGFDLVDRIHHDEHAQGRLKRSRRHCSPNQRRTSHRGGDGEIAGRKSV
jgi:hypothetical protein